MADKKNNQNDAQEKGFNSTAAYGDPKDNTHVQQKKPSQRDKENSPYSTDSEGNVGTDAEEAGSGIYTGQRADDLAPPGDNLTEGAEIGRNRGNAPMMDRQIEDVPANDPNAADAGPVKTGEGTGDVRTTDSVIDDLSSMGDSKDGISSTNRAASEVPTGDPTINDVPDADHSPADSADDLAQNAADRTRRNDGNK